MTNADSAPEQRPDQQRLGHQPSVDADVLDQVAAHEDLEDVGVRVAADVQGEGAQERSAPDGEHALDRRFGPPPLRLLLVLRLFEHRCVAQPAPQDVRRDGHERAREEHQPPTPAQHLLVGQQLHQDPHHGAERGTRRRTHEHQRGVPAALLLRGDLGEQHDAARLLRACPEPLQQPQQHQQHRRQQSDLVEARQRADQERRDAHQEQGRDQDELPAEPIPVAGEEQPTQRAGQEAHRVRGEPGDDPDAGRGVGEEDAGEDDGGRGAVDDEVVLLQRGADQPAPGGGAQVLAVDRVTGAVIDHDRGLLLLGHRVSLRYGCGAAAPRS